MGTEGRCKERASQREAWKKSKELTYGRGRLSRCVEVAWNSDPQKGAWKCIRKIYLERLHERIMNAKALGRCARSEREEGSTEGA